MAGMLHTRIFASIGLGPLEPPLCQFASRLYRASAVVDVGTINAAPTKGVATLARTATPFSYRNGNAGEVGK